MNELQKDTPERREEVSGPVVGSWFDGRLYRTLTHRYTEPMMAVDEASCACVHNSRQAEAVRKLGADDWHEQVASFLRTFSIQNSYRTKVFLSAPSLLFPRDMMEFYKTTASVNENRLATKEITI